MVSSTLITIQLLGLLACAFGVKGDFKSASNFNNDLQSTTRWISWWYACDNNFPNAVSMIANHISSPSNLVTSVQTYCGWTVSDAGTIIGETSPQCMDFFGNITALNVKAELTLDGGNCSIDAYRALWKDTVVAPQVLLQAAQVANASGWNIDLEPQADSCKGSPTGTPADAVLFATWLNATRQVLNAAGVRLTVDVASWSPVLSQFGVLASGVDRVQNMETYNGDSSSEWMGYYTAFLSQVPLDKVGVGIGTWQDAANNTTWWETDEGASFKINQTLKDNVPELACFRLVPTPEVNPAWPLGFWWNELARFMQG